MTRVFFFMQAYNLVLRNLLSIQIIIHTTNFLFSVQITGSDLVACDFVDSYPRNLSSAKLRCYTVIAYFAI